MATRVVCLGLSIALVSSGCSLAFTKSPDPPRPVPVDPDCTSSKAAVYGDGILMGAAMGTSLFLGLAALADSDNRSDLGYATLFTFLGGVVFAVSGVIGGMRVQQCRDAEERWRLTQPQPFPGPPPPNPLGTSPPPGFPPPPHEAMPGTERGLCRLAPDPPCDAGLTCLSGRCVVYVAP